MLSDGMSKLDLDGITSSDDSDDDSLGKDDSSAFMTSIGSRPSSLTSRVPNSKFRDISVPPLDLSAQSTLLEESQKLNQSIKRCLGHAESMLASGKKALESGTKLPDDGPLGARVLSPEEIEGDADNRRQGLLSPVAGNSSNIENPWERSLAQSIDSIGAKEVPAELASMLSHYPSQSGPKAEGRLGNGDAGETGQHSSDESLEESMIDEDNNRAAKDGVSELSVPMMEPLPDYSKTAVASARSPSINNKSPSMPAAIGPLTPREELLKEPLSPSNQVRSSTILPSIEQPEYAIEPGRNDGIQVSSIDPSLTQPGPPHDSGPLAEDANLPSEPASEDLIQKHNVNPNTPGNRGSLQEIGNYLSSWSKYAAGIRPP